METLTRRSKSAASTTRKTMIIAALVIVAVIAIFHESLLSRAGNYLKLGCESTAGLTQQKPVDAIIVLGGEIEGERTRKGVELYKQGIAPKLILSDGTRMSWRTMAIDEMVALAKVSGVPERDIVQEKESRSTYENAAFTKELMISQSYDSAVVVTTDWHAKRSRFIFNKVYKDSGIALYYCGTPDSRSEFGRWWTDSEKQQTVLTEWAKTIMYWVRY